MSETNGQEKKSSSLTNTGRSNDFVLEKSIFSNIFEKDIQRVYIYKKAERLAKAVHLITPAFYASPALAQRADEVAIALVDAAILPPGASRAAFARELLALSSILAIAKSSGTLSIMNAELIAREAQLLLQEVAAYEPPRLVLEEVPSFAAIAERAPRPAALRAEKPLKPEVSKGQVKDISLKDNRRDAVLAVLKEKGSVYIKDISKVVRDISEKTLQRELASLVLAGIVKRQGERRWTLYSLA